MIAMKILHKVTNIMQKKRNLTIINHNGIVIENVKIIIRILFTKEDKISFFKT